MEGINVLFGVYYTEQGLPVVRFLCEKLKKELNENGVFVENVDVAKDKKQIEEKLAGGNYRVLICNEQLGEDRIGGGSLKAWGANYPNIKIILSVGSEKKGGEKLVKLVNNIPNYYDAVFENDLTGGNVAALLAKPRTREEAIAYYGLENRVGLADAVAEESVYIKEIDLENANSASEQDDETKPIEAGAVGETFPNDSVDSSDNVREVVEEAVTEDELEKAVEGFGDMDFEFEDSLFNEPKEEKTEEVVKEEKENVGFDYSSMFGSSDMFTNSGAIVEQADIIEEVTVAEVDATFEEAEEDMDALLREAKDVEKAVIELIERDNQKSGAISRVENVERVEEVFEIVQGSRKVSEVCFPDRGKVIKVFDYNTMLLELSDVLALPQCEQLADYKMIFIVKGSKGGFVNGKYKVGVKNFEGYPGSLLGARTVIVEVPDYDLVENKIEACECNIVFMKQ